MEREILFSGIGGQGVQLAARMLAVAVMRDGRRALMFGSYGGEMRGGYTDATVVVGTGSLLTPPIVDFAWAGVAMHPSGWPAMAEKLRPRGIVLINTSVFKEDAVYDGTVLPLKASGIAAEAGMPQAGAMVALGAFVAATGVAPLASLDAIAEELLPPYRRQFAAANRLALKMGYEAVPGVLCPAWQTPEVAV